jgi:TRAP-type C4-dicarboxylate transport system substrate-binding protein
VGLCRIHQPILNVQAPLLVRTEEELVYILDKMKPRFEEGLLEKGFVVLMWNRVGWVHFFSKRPVSTPGDLRKLKLFVWAGDPDGVQAWKEMGFHPVPLTISDLATALQSGMVEAFTTTPLSAASFQWFTLAPHMCELSWAPLLGAIVVSRQSWERIPAELRPKLQQAAVQIGAAMQTEISQADKSAVAAMQQNGLTVNAVPPAAQVEWTKAVAQGMDKVFGKSFDKELYTTVVGLLEEFRRAHPAAPAAVPSP